MFTEPLDVDADADALQLPGLAGRGGVHHAFSTRRGGAPAGGRMSRELVLQAGGFSATAEVVLLDQVHGTTVHRVGHPPAPATPRPAADASVTRRCGPVLVVQTADCAAVLLADPGAGVIAAVHAGWRGVVAGILARTVAVMEALGAVPSRLSAAIGPAIGPCCFEVGEEVATLFGAIDAALVDRSRPRPRLDLPAAAALLLTRDGVLPAAIERVDLCTVCRPDLFFSHRREQGRAGRLFAAIALTH